MNLNEWLDDVLSRDNIITLYDGTVTNFRLMVEKCEQAGLIEFASVDNRLNITYRRIPATEPATPPTGARFTVMRAGNNYAVLDEVLGEQVEGTYTGFLAQAETKARILNAMPRETSSEFAPATPPTETVGAGDGERGYYLDSDNGYWQLYKAGANLPLAQFAESERYAAESATRLLVLETAALRAELARLHAHGESMTLQWSEQLDSAKTELAAAREQVAKLTAELSEKGREVDTMQDSIDDLNHMVDLARAERNSVKAQLAECQHAHELARTQRDAATELYSSKKGRIEELKRELEVSRDARKALEKVIQTAATYLAETNSSDENVGRAYNVLSGFASAD